MKFIKILMVVGCAITVFEVGKKVSQCDNIFQSTVDATTHTAESIQEWGISTFHWFKNLSVTGIVLSCMGIAFIFALQIIGLFTWGKEFIEAGTKSDRWPFEKVMEPHSAIIYRWRRGITIGQLGFFTITLPAFVGLSLIIYGKQLVRKILTTKIVGGPT